jgi:thioredoxin 1
MPAVQLTTDLETEILKDGITVVDYYADWCGPCKMVAPSMETLSEIEGVKVIKVNVDEFKELAGTEDVTTLPTIRFYKDGELKQSSGPAPVQALKNIITGLQ